MVIKMIIIAFSTAKVHFFLMNDQAFLQLFDKIERNKKPFYDKTERNNLWYFDKTESKIA